MISDNSGENRLNPRLFERYLKLKGWSSRPLKSDKRYLWIEDQEASEPIEVLLSLDGKSEVRDLDFALTTVAQYYNVAISDIAAEARSLAFDVIMSRIPDEYVRNDSIELRIASEYVDRMKALLAATASTELSGDRHIQRMRKEGIEFSEKCRFGHTFRGSFGFQIESPVGLNDEPFLDEALTRPPLGRKVVERLSCGLTSLARASKLHDASEVVKESNGLSSNMCDVIAGIIRDIGLVRVDFQINFSPEWPTHLKSDSAPFSLVHSHVELLDDAARALRVKEEPRSATIVGRIKRLETIGNPADLVEDRSKREIEIIWAIEEGKSVAVKIALSPEDYLLSLEAHGSGRPVVAVGMLQKMGKSWRLESITSFSIV